jgi:hypothetical protein
VRKRNKAQKMINAISLDDPVMVVAVSPALIDEINEGCRKVDALLDEYSKMLGM